MLLFAWFKKKKHDDYDEYDEEYDDEFDDDDYEDYDDEEYDDDEEEEEDRTKYDYEAIAGKFERENARLFKDNERLKKKLVMAEEELKMTAIEKQQLHDRIETMQQGTDFSQQSTKKQLNDTIELYTQVNEENQLLKKQLEKINTYSFDVLDTEKKLAKYNVLEKENIELKTQLTNVKIDLADAVLNAKEMAKDIITQASNEANVYQTQIQAQRKSLSNDINEIYYELDQTRLKLNGLFTDVRTQVDELKTLAENENK
ncbi:hypothetical protein CKN63_04995 [Carnobacterium divergens]|uniref:hypothetical protein n=1 Tax=Carnobacterium divergens TaxID=2748 RepID=UPI001071B71A|nr:hypothetical protein [Carnobacterium divergens]MDT1996194.1 hypothetical protein [Carnobacterium divergens]TFI66431.1 hypothetical protein CKN76_05035 [Carnobacterium divergens]TFI66481.1 hypothetical protein CKN59_04950 [Carnobacterium divergens]TFI81491.1 hypothetical protein CKN74_05000 [Carnobacterium divergens]TFI92291.1 hypothetical protein CKN61_04960 [Carnobacterium divergens]